MAKYTPHILIVEDEKDLAEILAYNLRKADFHVSLVFSGSQALETIAQKLPDLLLLDLMLPGLSGTEIAARVRSNPVSASLPIIMITAKGSEMDQIAGLATGADDYVAKPFSPKVLIARIHAVLRRSRNVASADASPAGSLTLGPVTISTDSHEVLVDGQPIKLTLTEFKILTTLVTHTGRVLSRATLMSRAMGPGVTVTERTIDVHVTAIRKKLGRSQDMIQTIRGVGYKASLEPSAQE